MRILVSYRGIPQSRGWATGDSVVRAFRELGHDAIPYAKYYERNEWVETITPKTFEEPFDLLLFMECNDGDQQYINLLNRTEFRVRASWYFDVAMSQGYLDWWRRLGKSFDFNFVANRSLPDAVPNGHYLPYAADPALHFRDVDAKTRDIILIGSDRSDRRAVITALQDAGLNAELISSLFREEYIDALASSWLALNDVAGGGSGLLPMRVFEAPAAGSVLVTPTRNGAEEIMGDDAVYWDTVPNLIQSCGRLLENKALLLSLSLHGQDNIEENHLYTHRCEEILETCFA